MLASLLLMAAVAAPRTDSRVQPLTGPAVEGELLDLNAAELRLRTVDGERTFSLRDLLHVAVQGGAKPSDSSPTVWVTLVDGSLLLANGYESAGGKAVVRLLGHGAAEVSTSAIRCVRWASQDEILAKQWREIAASEAAGDLIVVRRTPAALDQWEGVLHDIGEEAVQFELDGQRVSIPRVKLEGVLYYQSAGRELGEPVCRVSDLFGSQWSVQSLRLQNGQVQLTTTAGVSFRLPVQRVEKFDFAAGNVAYLSDLEPSSSTWAPFFPASAIASKLATLYQPRRDRSFDGGKLLLAGRAYEKGLAIHSRSELVYRLTDDFRRFRAVVGIDDRVREGGNVKLVIAKDGQVLWSKSVDGKQPPLELDLDVAGVRRLSILVDFGEDLDIADHLNLCDARLTK